MRVFCAVVVGRRCLPLVAAVAVTVAVRTGAAGPAARLVARYPPDHAPGCTDLAGMHGLAGSCRVRPTFPAPGTFQPGRGSCAPPLPPIGLTAADLFAAGDGSRADSRVR